MRLWHWLVVAGFAVGVIWNHGWYGLVVVAVSAVIIALVAAEQRRYSRFARRKVSEALGRLPRE